MGSKKGGVNAAAVQAAKAQGFTTSEAALKSNFLVADGVVIVVRPERKSDLKALSLARFGSRGRSVTTPPGTARKLALSDTATTATGQPLIIVIADKKFKTEFGAAEKVAKGITRRGIKKLLVVGANSVESKGATAEFFSRVFKALPQQPAPAAAAQQVSLGLPDFFAELPEYIEVNGYVMNSPAAYLMAQRFPKKVKAIEQMGKAELQELLNAPPDPEWVVRRNIVARDLLGIIAAKGSVFSAALTSTGTDRLYQSGDAGLYWGMRGTLGLNWWGRLLEERREILTGKAPAIDFLGEKIRALRARMEEQSARYAGSSDALVKQGAKDRYDKLLAKLIDLQRQSESRAVNYSIVQDSDDPYAELRKLSPQVLAGCGEDGDRPTLNVYMLPQVRVMWYVAWNLLFLASSGDVHRVIEKAGSQSKAIGALKKFKYKGIFLELPADQAKRLYFLSRSVACGAGNPLPWALERTAHNKIVPVMVAPDPDSGEVEALPDFGIIQRLFGKVGTEGAIKASFFNSPQSPPSLQHMLFRYALAAVPTGDKRDDINHPEPIYREITGAPGSASIALIVGRLDDPYAMGLKRAGRRVQPWRVFFPIAQALIDLPSAVSDIIGPDGKAGVHASVCLHLPDQQYVGNANRAKEVTEVRAVESYFQSPRAQSPTKVHALKSYFIPVMRVKLSLPQEGSTAFGRPRSGRFSDVQANRIHKLLADNNTISEYAQTDESYFTAGEDEALSLPQVLSWAALYTQWVMKFVNLDKLGLHEMLDDNNMLYPQYLYTARAADLASAGSMFFPQSRTSEQLGMDAKIVRKRLSAEHIPAFQEVTVEFMQDLQDQEESSTAGALVPVSAMSVPFIDKGQPTPRGSIFFRYAAVTRFNQAKDENKNLMPVITTKVKLIRLPHVRKQIEILKREGRLPDIDEALNVFNVKAFLHKNAFKLDDDYFLLIPRAWATVLNDVTVTDVTPSGTLSPAVRAREEKLWAPFQNHKRYILDIIARLMRLRVATVFVQGAAPFKQLVAVEDGDNFNTPWTSLRLPYLLAKLPTPVICKHGKAETENEQLLGPNEEPHRDAPVCMRPGPADSVVRMAKYATILKDSFSYGRTSDIVKAGRALAAAGLASVGTRGARLVDQKGALVRESRSVDPTRVITSKGFSKVGFYALVMDTYVASQLDPTRLTAQLKEDPTYVKLNMVVRRLWPLIQRYLMDKGFSESEYSSPPTIKKDQGIQEGTAVHTVLVLVQDMMQNFSRYGFSSPEEVINYGNTLVHPRMTPANYSKPVTRTFEYIDDEGDEVSEEVVFAAPDLDDDFSDMIYSIENPRSSRRKRYRERKAAQNPLKDDELANVQNYFDNKRILPERIQFTRPESNEQLREAISAVFPERNEQGRRPPGTLLKRKDRLGSFGQHDIVGTGLEPSVDAANPPMAYGKIERGDTFEASGEDLKFLESVADLNFQDIAEIVQYRAGRAPKEQVVSASGSLCMLYRNTTRLQSYRPLALIEDDNAKSTYWIIVGVDTSRPKGFRIMTFRNGSYVDCDMLLDAATPAEIGIGRAIRTAVLWLAERKVRPLNLSGGIKLGVVGKGHYWQLWSQGQKIDGRDMVNNALVTAPSYYLQDPGANNPALKEDLAAFKAASAKTRPYPSLMDRYRMK